MYKVANAQRVILFSGLYFLLLGNLFASSGSQDKNLPVAISYETMTESERVEAGLVAAVDSGKLTEAKSWSYTLKQGGDYQLGTAWVEVLSAGEVEIVMTLNGKVVKTVTASNDPSKVKGRTSDDFGFFRLESRFEELAPGSRIEIKAVPSGDVAYRLAFHLVSTTPDFTGLKVLNVADFGAVGDGLTDDMAAIHKAVDAAKAAGGAIIRFEKEKHYRVIGKDDLTYEVAFELFDTANIKIEGHGSTIILHPPDGLAKIQRSRNIQIDGLFVDYDPLPYYQGKVTEINIEKMTVDLVVPERYPVPLTGKCESKSPYFARSFAPDHPGARTSHKTQSIYIDSVTALDDPRHVRLHVGQVAKGSDFAHKTMKPRLIVAKKAGATEFIVPHKEYGHRDGLTSILRSARIKFSNVRYYVVPYFWMQVKGNSGPVTFENVDLKMKHPETELLASWRDGFHIKNARFGTLIDGCDMDGAAQYDDTFAIYTRIHNVVSQESNTLTMDAGFRDHKDLHTWVKGDWVSIWNKDQTHLRGMARIVALQNVPESEKRFHLTFEQLPSGIEPGDVVINDEVLNRGTLIRNCTTSSTGAGPYASTRFRASDIRFENTRFESFHFKTEFNPFWGTPRSRGVSVKECTFGGPRTMVTLSSPIGVHFEDCHFDGVTVVAPSNAEKVVFTDSSWSNVDKMIDAGSSSTMFLEGDITVNGKNIRQLGSEVKNHISGARGSVRLDGKVLEIKSPTIKEKITGGVVVTIKDPGYKETGAWADSGLPGYKGGKSRFSDKGGRAVFASPLNKAGEYTVYIYRVAHPSNDARQGIVINNGGGSESLVVDMRMGPSGWVELGSYAFKGTKKEGVVVKPGSGISPARCSALMFVLATPER